MKKKLLSLLMICIMVLSSFTVSFAAEAAPAPSVKDTDLTPVSGADAIAAIATQAENNTIFLDLRAAVDYAAGHIKNTTSAPVCLSAAEEYAVPLANKEAFIAQMAALNINNYSKIYLSCYAGTFCVNYAADWLIGAYGAEIASKLIRVSGGTFNDADLKAASFQSSPAYALADANGIILDVRAVKTYEANGYLDKSVHQPVFGWNESTGKPDINNNAAEVAAFNEFIDANKDFLSSKNIHILCNSGMSGAAKATALLNAKGITKVYTIDGGAGYFSANQPELLVTPNKVAGADTVATIGVENSGVVIIDVRAKEVYDKGHLKTAISMPLFTVVDGKNKVTNGYDALAQAFLASVAANAEKLAGKDIHVVCNSGASGAKAATKLLMQAGYSNADIFTVIGGGSGKDTEDKSVPNNSTYVSADQAVSVLGNDAYVIIDVRAEETCKANGQLKGAVQQPVFVIGADGKPSLTGNEKEIEAFNAYVEANKATLAGKTIYILCNSGSRGAAKAIELLAAKGITNVFTIEGGATNQAIKDAFAGNTPAPAPQPSKPTSPVTGETLSTGYILLMLALVLAFVSKKRFA